jgi:hypothetical protein
MRGHHIMPKMTVTLGSKLAGEYTIFAKEAGISFEKAVHDALDEWMEHEGASLYNALLRRRAWMEANPVKSDRAYRMYQTRQSKAERAAREKAAA